MTKYQHEIQKYLKNTRIKILTSASDTQYLPFYRACQAIRFFLPASERDKILTNTSDHTDSFCS